MRGVVIFLSCVAAAGRGDGSDEWKEHTRCNSPTLSRMLRVTNLNPSVAGCVCMPSVYVCMLDFFVFGGKFISKNESPEKVLPRERTIFKIFLSFKKFLFYFYNLLFKVY